MSEHKNQPFHKAFLWFILCIGGLGVFFGLLISLTSSASFLEIFGWIMVFGLVIAIPTFFWGYVLEPNWWDKLSLKGRERAGWWIAAVITAGLIVAWGSQSGGNSWTGQGQVQLFPQGAASKNYQLSAQITVTSKSWWRHEYTVNSVDWPDSGTSNLSSCTLDSVPNICTDEQGRSWRVVMSQAPERDPSGNEGN